MIRRILLVLAFLFAAFGCREATGPGNSLPRGVCRLISFRFEGYGIRLGPELYSRDSMPLAVSALSSARSEFVGQTRGVSARWRSDYEIDGSAEEWFPLVFPGQYRGTWRLDGDSLAWNFDDDGGAIDWIIFRSWRVRGHSLVASWRNEPDDPEQWLLESEVWCA